MNNIQFYKNKNLLLFDLETTGLPHTPKFNEYYNYIENDKYDSSRIVSIAWCILKDFPNNEDITCKHYIRKIDSNIIISNSHIHGITNDIATKNGIELSTIFDEFIKDLNDVDILVAHNIKFDYNILLNELYRLKPSTNTYLEIVLNYKNKLLCTCELFKKICNKRMYNGMLKFPKLTEVYQFFFNNLPEISHSANHDVTNLAKILLHHSKLSNI